MATLHEGDTIKYEVSCRIGNRIERKEFASRESALEYADSFYIKTNAKWIVLTTIEKMK